MAILKKNKNKKMLTIVAVFVIVIALYLVFLSFNSDTSSDLDFITSSGEKDFLEIDFNLLNDEVMSEFHSWSSVPVDVGSTGRSNPFSQ